MDLTTGKQLKIFRPPISDGREGEIDAVAISPDSKIIICGGYTGWTWEEKICLYVFNRDSGTIIKRLKGIPEVVHDIKFPEDGKYFGVASEYGVRLYRSSDYSLIAADETYGGPCHCLNFYASSYLNSVADDGYIRLYDLRSLTKKNGRAEKIFPANTKI